MSRSRRDRLVQASTSPARRAPIALLAVAAALTVVLTAACSSSGPAPVAVGADLGRSPVSSAPSASSAPVTAVIAVTGSAAGPSSSGPSSSGPSSSGPSSSTSGASGSGQGTDSQVALAAPAPGALSGRVVVIDPGHNGANGRHTAQINRLVDIGNGRKACDTTGTQTDAGYAESAYTFDVATRLQALLRAAGATVVLTRATDNGVGPCITERAAIGNRAHADAAISIHGDGAPAAGHGFHVIVPIGIGRNDAIVAPSRRLGVDVRDGFRAGTGEPLSSYTGTTTAGIVARKDLGGLNMSTVPKVFIECGNMRNAVDARRMTDPAWRQRAAVALAAGITRFLTVG